MTKGFYRLMCVAVAGLMSLIGCDTKNEPPVEYGPGPTDYDRADGDEFEGTLYGDRYTEYDKDLVPTDTDEQVVTPDEPAIEYGPVKTDCDDLLPDTDEPVVVPYEPPLEYGPYPTDYDEYGNDEFDGPLYGDPYTEYDKDLVSTDDDGVVEQPDEMQTDYGPVSSPFKKK